jgi:hypothetical protein
VLVNLAYIPFEWHALALAPVEEVSAHARRFAKMRSLFTLGTFVVAMLVSLKFPSLGFALICCALLVYLWPEFPRFGGDMLARFLRAAVHCRSARQKLL